MPVRWGTKHAPQEIRKDWIEDKAIEPCSLKKKRECLRLQRGQGGEWNARGEGMECVGALLVKEFMWESCGTKQRDYTAESISGWFVGTRCTGEVRQRWDCQAKEFRHSMSRMWLETDGNSTEEVLIKGLFTKVWAGLRENKMVPCPGARNSRGPFPSLLWRDKEASIKTQRS